MENPIPLPARNGVSFSPRHTPPSGLMEWDSWDFRSHDSKLGNFVKAGRLPPKNLTRFLRLNKTIFKKIHYFTLL